MVNKKGDLEFSFAWIFAIMAGLLILFLAIYGVTKFINISKETRSAETAVEIGVLTNPLESSFESAQRTLIDSSIETRIYSECTSDAFLGKQKIQISQKTYDEWGKLETAATFPNKYIFSTSPVEGRTFYLFSKSFDAPFKVADLIYLTSTKDKYCFKNAPRALEDEIEHLTGEGEDSSGIENFYIKDCPIDSINICFATTSSSCDIVVSSNSVTKDGATVYYDGEALMFAAIFSDKETYECQLKRLMQRTTQLADVYLDKSQFIFQKTGCDSGLNLDLSSLKQSAGSLTSSQQISTIFTLSESLEIRNNYGGECPLW